MEFWAVTVDRGVHLKVHPGDRMLLHLSQVEKNQGTETVCLFVKVGDEERVLGTLFPNKLPQQQFDLVFDKGFELSHDWKAGSVYFYGYKATNPEKEEEDDSEDDESDDDMGSKDDKDEDDVGSENDSDEDEETPKRVETGKKRAAESATETPVPKKKAKVASPQKSDGKKGGGHMATPHPSKQAGKTPANKSNQQTPKSGGSFACPTCKKTFGSEIARRTHSKDKHSGGK